MPGWSAKPIRTTSRLRQMPIACTFEPSAQGFNFNTGQNFGEVNGCGGPNASGYYYNGTYSLFLVKPQRDGDQHFIQEPFSGRHAGCRLGAQIALDAKKATSMSQEQPTLNGPVGTFAATGQYPYPTTPSAYQPQLAGQGPKLFAAFVTELSPTDVPYSYSSMFGGPNDNTYNNAWPP